MEHNINLPQFLIDWAKELNLSITISDLDDNIVYMNDLSKKTFHTANIGDNLAHCHSDKSKHIITNLKKNNESNSYTIQKNGVKKLIYQTPWFVNNNIAGLVEFSIILPNEMPHYNRDKEENLTK